MTRDNSTSPFADDIARCCETLRRGGIIIYPTDTIWGIGCDATRSDAVRKVFELKHRSDSKALITLVADTRQLERYVDGIPDVAYDLIEFSTKPLTIVYDRGVGLAPELLADDGSVGVRVASDDFCRELLRAFRKPIVSTSANISGSPSPACFAEIDPGLITAADYVAQWRRGDRTPAKASSIMKISESGLFTVIRP